MRRTTFYFLVIIGSVLSGCAGTPREITALDVVPLAILGPFYGVPAGVTPLPGSGGGGPPRGSFPGVAPRNIQSADPKCPGWAIASIALNDYPLPKAVGIISSMTVGAKSRYYSMDEISREMLKVGGLVHAKCDNPTSRDYTKLEWSCSAGGLECRQKQAFAKEYESVLRMTDQDRGVAALKNLLGQSYAEDEAP